MIAFYVPDADVDVLPEVVLVEAFAADGVSPPFVNQVAPPSSPSLGFRSS